MVRQSVFISGGTGVVMNAGNLTLEFALEALGGHRMQARAIGAVLEGGLRKPRRKIGESLDQPLWSILRDDRRQTKAVWGASIVMH